ncbi:MAG: Crp/Fnr family transcriptional regulator [Bacteroidaceae bacterium]
MKEITNGLKLITSSRYPDMPDEVLDILNRVVEKKELSKGEILFKEGDYATYIVGVKTGLIRQFYVRNGKDITEHFSYEGCTLMCLESFLKEEPTKLQAEALEPSIVYLISKEKLERLIKSYREIGIYYRKVLEYSLIQSQIKADLLRYETAKERYIHLGEEQPEVLKRAPLAYIASYLIMTPETLSRVRNTVIQEEIEKQKAASSKERNK